MDKLLTLLCGTRMVTFSIKKSVSLLFILLLSTCLQGLVVQMLATGQEPVVDTGTPVGTSHDTVQSTSQGTSSENIPSTEKVAPQPPENVASQPAEQVAPQPADNVAPQPPENVAPQPAEQVAPQPADNVASQLAENAAPQPEEQVAKDKEATTTTSSSTTLNTEGAQKEETTPEVEKSIESTITTTTEGTTTTAAATPEPQRQSSESEPIHEEAPKPARTGTLFAEAASPDAQPLADAPSLKDPEDPEDSFGLPGAQYEFKVEVGGGEVECFYQKFKRGAQVHLSFQVMRGADKNIDMMVRDPNNGIIEQIQWTSESSWNGVIEMDGIHSICFDNSHSRFSSKLVYFYLIGYVEEDWRRFAEESQKYLGGIENFTTFLLNVDQKLNKMAVLQATSRRHMINDFYMVLSNKLVVQNLSIMMCIVILVCAAFQVYFVRRLFNTGSSHISKGFRPRA